MRRVFCLHVSVYMCIPTQNRRSYHTRDPWNWSYASLCWCWKSNQGFPARAVNVLLTAEPSLSPTTSFLNANRDEFRCLRLSNLLAQLVKALDTKLFIQSGTTAHGMMKPTFSVGLSTSNNQVQKLPHRHAQSLVS